MALSWHNWNRLRRDGDTVRSCGTWLPERGQRPSTSPPLVMAGECVLFICSEERTLDWRAQQESRGVKTKWAFGFRARVDVTFTGVF